MARLSVTYYMDVLSSWCTYAEPALAQLRTRFGADLTYDWRIAALHNGEPMQYTPEAMTWYYQRSGSMSGIKLNAAWLESADDGSWWPNLAAEAARSLGVKGDRVRLALARSALLDGIRVQRRDVAEAVAAEAGGLEPVVLRAAMEDPAVEARLRETTAEFRRLPCTVVPTFVLRNEIGDVNLLSGAFRYDHLAACAEQLAADADAYAAFGAANPAPPSVIAP